MLLSFHSPSPTRALVLALFQPFRSLPAYELREISITAVDPFKKQSQTGRPSVFSARVERTDRIERVPARSDRWPFFDAPFRFLSFPSLPPLPPSLTCTPAPLSADWKRPVYLASEEWVQRDSQPASSASCRSGAAEDDAAVAASATSAMASVRAMLMLFMGVAFEKSLNCEARERGASVSVRLLFVGKERERKRKRKWKEKKGEKTKLCFRKVKKKGKKKRIKTSSFFSSSLSPSLLLSSSSLRIPNSRQNDVDPRVHKELFLFKRNERKRERKKERKKRGGRGRGTEISENERKVSSLFSLSTSSSSTSLFLPSHFLFFSAFFGAAPPAARVGGPLSLFRAGSYPA
jgi:hypothetical protein